MMMIIVWMNIVLISLLPLTSAFFRVPTTKFNFFGVGVIESLSGDSCRRDEKALDNIEAKSNKNYETFTSKASQSLSQGVQRGKVLADDFNERDLLRAYREIKSEYYKKAFGSNQWRVLSTLKPDKLSSSNPNDETINVSLMEHPSDPLCPYVKMEAVLPVSVKECWNFLLLDRWDETMPKMDPFYEGVDIFGEYFVEKDDVTKTKATTIGNVKGDAMAKPKNSAKHAALKLPFGFRTRALTQRQLSTSVDVAADGSLSGIHMILARKRTKRILAFGKREFLFLSVKDEPLEDGTWVSGTVSVDFPTKIPRTKSYTRAFQDSIAFYKPLFEKKENTRTKLTIVCRIDLNDSSEDGAGGWIPMWLYVKTIGATGARSVLNMRKALLEDRQATNHSSSGKTDEIPFELTPPLISSRNSEC